MDKFENIPFLVPIFLNNKINDNILEYTLRVINILFNIKIWIGLNLKYF